MSRRSAADRFAAEPHARGRGSVAEQAGCEWLQRRGYQIHARNYRTHWAELDAVAMEGDTLCFVEIKARRNADLGSPLEAVTRHKQARIARAAALYLVESGWQGACRFDVLGMMTAADGDWSYELIRDAFDVPDGA